MAAPRILADRRDVLDAQPATHAALSAQTRFYSPSADELRRTLSDMADGLHSQLCELYARPDPAAAEAVAANLSGAARAVLRYREALLREGTEDARR